METLEGVVVRMRVNNDDFCVGVLERLSDSREVVFLGGFTSFPGETLRMKGEYQQHPQYGTQFRARRVEKKPPREPKLIRKLLSSGIMKGIGTVTANALVDHFQERTLDVLDNQSNLLIQVHGIGPVKAKKISEVWDHHRKMAPVMSFLFNYDFSLSIVKEVVNEFGVKAEDVLRSNPYIILQIKGVGWTKADRFAMRLGIAHDNPNRIAAATLHSLLNCRMGHTYMPHALLKAEVEILTSVDFSGKPGLFDKALDQLEIDELIVITSDGVYHKWMYMDEVTIARRLLVLDGWNIGVKDKEALLDAVTLYEASEGITFTHGQRRAIKLALTKGVSIITGSPGTGKTSLLAGIISALEDLGLKYGLAAPTGKAAKRIQQKTGRDAQTIHRLLQFNPGRGAGSSMFVYNDYNPLPLDAIIIDEASMIDTELMSALVKATRAGTRLVIVGDADQLESVGPGNVLHDLIESNAFHTTALKTIFRQAQQSLIITNAERVNNGTMPLTGSSSDSDVDFLWSKKVALSTIKYIVEHLPKKYPDADINEFQIITPFRKRITDINMTTINEVIQKMKNPTGEHLPIKDCILRVGDKVIQTQNNYDLNVFNGDVGVISFLHPDYKGMTGNFDVTMDNQTVTYQFRDADQLELAYAITVHRSQGSEYKYVVVALPTSSRGQSLLRRNLLYTAITRASKKCILVASEHQVKRYLSNANRIERFTGLQQRILDNRRHQKKKKSHAA